MKVITGAQCWYDEWDVSGEATGLSPAPELEIKEFRPFNSSSVKKEPGIRNDSLSLEGVLSLSGDTGTGFFDEIGNTHPLSLHVSGSTVSEGDDSVIANIINTKIDHPIAQGDLHPFTLSGAVAPPGIVFGKVLGIGVKSATGNTASGETFAAVAAGQTIVAALHVKGTPTGTTDVIIESAATGDSGFASPTTRLTFTQVTTSATSEYITAFSTSGITDTLWRAKWTQASTPSADLSVAFGVI